MRSALVLDGRFRVFEDGTIFRIRNGVDIPAKTFDVGRASSKTKYKIVSYMDNGKQKNIAVHRLVAIAFIPNPENKPEVDHINVDRKDNRVENLRWATRKENMSNPLNKNKVQAPSILGGEALEKLRKELAERGIILLDRKPRLSKKRIITQ